MAAGLSAASITVSVRGANGSLIENREWSGASIDQLAAAAPWRTFRWYRGQRHYSGTYWSATMRDHVIYESRPELARLLFADFDPSVRRVVAQPFLLKTEVDGAVRKHIPDYLLVTDEVPVVVDVKPLHRWGNAFPRHLTVGHAHGHGRSGAGPAGTVVGRVQGHAVPLGLLPARA